VGLRVRAMHVQRMLRRVKSPRQILDAGCGDGSYTFHLARRFPEARVLGIDASAQLIDDCERRRTRRVTSNLVFERLSLIELSPQNRYDLILCIDVLEHLVEDGVALQNLQAALSPGGFLILHVPQRRSLNRHTWRPLGDEYVREHVREEYSEDEIKRLIAESGLEVLARRYTFGILGALAREIYYTLDPWPRAPRRMLLAAIFPVLLALAVGDTWLGNLERHQGFLLLLRRVDGRPDGACR